MLCAKCSNIHFKSFGKCNEIRQDALLQRKIKLGYRTLEKRGFYVHHKDANELKRSIAAGCHFCAAIWYRSFEEKSTRLLRPDDAHSEVVFSRAWPVQGSLRDKPSFLQTSDELSEITIRWGSMTTNTNLHRSESAFSEPEKNMLRSLTSGNAVGSLYSHEFDSATMYTYQQDYYTTSPANIALARLWVQHCLESHGPCKTFHQNTTLPTRVLNISNPRYPRLELGDGRQSSYIALSYKWGHCAKFLLMSHNVNEFQEQIPAGLLPKTFQQAIEITHALGFSYIWIDALCIVQDSNEEKTHEINTMDQIFRGSVLTIFAAAGDDANAGLAVQRDPRGTKPCLLTVQTTFNNQTTTERFYPRLYSPHYFKSPLYDRGWVLQEQVLAPRALLFSADQMAWRCICEYVSEESPVKNVKVSSIQEIPFTRTDDFNLLRMWLSGEGPPSDGFQGPRANHFDHWYDLISKYSRCSLSYHTDVLAAVAGVANALANAHEATYLSGLWKEDLQLGLLWYVFTDPTGQDGKTGKDAVTNNIYYQPSWSWAANWNKTIRWLYLNVPYVIFQAQGVWPADWPIEGQAPNKPSDSSVPVSPKKKKRFSIFRKSKQLDTSVDQVIETNEPTSRPLTKTPLNLIGKVRQGRIDLKAEVETNGFEYPSPEWIRTVKDAETNEIVGEIALDSDPAIWAPENISVLLCAVREVNNKTQLAGLGLVPTGPQFPNEYMRVGLFVLRKLNWFARPRWSHPDKVFYEQTIRLV